MTDDPHLIELQDELKKIMGRLHSMESSADAGPPDELRVMLDRAAAIETEMIAMSITVADRT